VPQFKLVVLQPEPSTATTCWTSVVRLAATWVFGPD